MSFEVPPAGEPTAPSTGPVAPLTRRSLRGQTVFNTAVTGVSNVWAMVAGLVSVPFVLHGLGALGFGRWVLLQTFSASTGWLVILDLGLGTAVTRSVAASSAASERGALGVAMGTGLAMFGALAVAGAVAAEVAVMPILGRLGHFPPQSQGQLRLSVYLLGGQVAAELVMKGCGALLEGVQRVDLSRSAEMGRRAAATAGPAVVAVVTHRIVAVEAAMTAAAILGALLAGGLLIAFRPVASFGWSAARAREVLSYASLMAWTRPISALYRLMNQVIVAVLLGPAAVAIVEVAQQVQSGVSAVLGAASYSLIPTTAWLEASGDREGLRRTLRRGSLYVLMVTAPVAVGVAMVATPGIRLWLGTRYLSAAGPAAIAAAGLGVSAVGQVGAYLLIGTGRASTVLWAQIVGVVVNLGASIVLVELVGVPGVFWGTLVSLGVTVPWFVLAACRLLGVEVTAHLRRCVAPMVAPLAVEVLVVGGIRLLGLPPGATLALGAVGGAGAVAFGVLRGVLAPGELREVWNLTFRSAYR